MYTLRVQLLIQIWFAIIAEGHRTDSNMLKKSIYLTTFEYFCHTAYAIKLDNFCTDNKFSQCCTKLSKSYVISSSKKCQNLHANKEGFHRAGHNYYKHWRVALNCFIKENSS